MRHGVLSRRQDACAGWAPRGRREGAECPPPGRRFTSRNRRFAPLLGGLGQRRQAEGLAALGFDFRDGFSLLEYVRTGTSASGLERLCPKGVPNRQKNPVSVLADDWGRGRLGRRLGIRELFIYRERCYRTSTATYISPSSGSTAKILTFISSPCL
jgi:hypothetical protein